MANIEIQRNVLVKLLNPSSTFTISLNSVDFIPDVLEIRNISANNTTGATLIISIRSLDLPLHYTNNQLLNLVMTNASFVNLPYVNTFKLSGAPISGNYNFQILNINDALQNITGGTGSTIQFYMNFIKYKK